MPRPRQHSPLIRTLLFGLGAILVLLSPVVGIIPGPGGIPVFAAGLVLMLQNSRWARHKFVVLKARWPKFGALADRALRRRSAKRRRARDRAERDAARQSAR